MSLQKLQNLINETKNDLNHPENLLKKQIKMAHDVNMCFEPTENRVSYGESFDDHDVPAEPWSFDPELLND